MCKQNNNFMFKSICSLYFVDRLCIVYMDKILVSFSSKFRAEISNTLRTMINSFNFWNIEICPIFNIILVLIVGEMPWYILHILMVSVLRFLSWIETELSISSSSSTDYFLSLYIKRRHLSWSLFVLLFFVRLWHIQTNWQ